MHLKEMPKFPPIKYDLQTRFGSVYGDEERKAILEVLERDAPTSNIKTVEFEKKFAEYCGVKYAISVSNGTAALQMAFKGIGIKPGDEVITTPITWIATAAAAVTMGAAVKFCDIDPRTFNMDPSKLESLITPKTKAICPVHLYGQPVDMDPIYEIAEKYGLKIIEDAAHAPGAEYKGKKAGNLGDVGCFSFHEQKNMSTLGEGGMITTNDPEIYEWARLYKSHCARVVGKSSKYLTLSEKERMEALDRGQYWYQDFDDCGYNFRMNDITAAVGVEQLKRLDDNNKKRREIADRLTEELSGGENHYGVKPLEVNRDVYHVYHLYPVLLDEKCPISRDELIYNLRMKYGIKVGVHYMPLVLTKAFRRRGFGGSDALVAVKMWPRLITLPIHPRLTDEAIDYLLKALKDETSLS